MRLIIVITCLAFSSTAYCQDSIRLKIDSSHYQQITAAGYTVYPYNKKRVRFVATASVAAYGSMMIALNSFWYSKYPRSNFHFFNDDAEWLQVDKVGHIYTSYIEGRAGIEAWRWTGLSRKKRIWIGGLSGAAYQTIIETLDGFSSEYGWSWGDFTANVLGAGSLISQELAWDEQRIKLKFSIHKKRYSQPDLEARATSLYGSSFAESLIKDYNAQTYWASANIQSLLHLKVPKWLGLSVGYGAEGLFGARSNIAKDKNGNIIFDRSDIKRYRQWFLSPDIDFTKIKTNKKAVRFLFAFLSAFKFPAPTLEFSNGSFKGHWIYF
ncbi:MAG: hypothetical protein JWN83_1783 [Chitinophagaceae bacterium]|nr:hypothetical protein [Chitinophagaceae bacterium]